MTSGIQHVEAPRLTPGPGVSSTEPERPTLERESSGATAKQSPLASVVRAFGARGAGIALSLASNIAVGRLLGASGAGVYVLFLTWTNLIGVVIAFGQPFRVLQRVSRFHTPESFGEARRTLRRSLALIAAGAAAVALLLVPLRGFASRLLLGDATLQWLLVASLVAGSLVATMRVCSEGLKARGAPAIAITIEFCLMPLGTVLALLAGRALMASVPSPLAIAGYLGGAATAVLSGAVLFARRTRVRGASAEARARSVDADGKPTTRHNVALWGADMLSIALTYQPLMMLPHFVSIEGVGTFGLAHRLAMLAAINIQALGSVFAPRFARLWASGDHRELRGALVKSQLYAVVSYLPLLAAFVFFGHVALGVFGAEFRSAATILWILGIGQLASACGGVAYYVLYMTNHAEWDVLSQAITIAASSLLYWVMGSMWGATGVAIACACALAIRSLTSYVFARRAIAKLRRSDLLTIEQLPASLAEA